MRIRYDWMDLASLNRKGGKVVVTCAVCVALADPRRHDSEGYQFCTIRNVKRMLRMSGASDAQAMHLNAQRC